MATQPSTLSGQRAITLRSWLVDKHVAVLCWAL